MSHEKHRAYSQRRVAQRIHTCNFVYRMRCAAASLSKHLTALSTLLAYMQCRAPRVALGQFMQPAALRGNAGCISAAGRRPHVICHLVAGGHKVTLSCRDLEHRWSTTLAPARFSTAHYLRAIERDRLSFSDLPRSLTPTDPSSVAGARAGYKRRIYNEFDLGASGRASGKKRLMCACPPPLTGLDRERASDSKVIRLSRRRHAAVARFSSGRMRA
jgi:hypothetical protein